MEGSLTARDRVGIQDFVLLDAYTSETAFMDNLRKRFNENLIYTYIGTLLVSVNPYKELGIYTKKQMDIYMGVNFFELPPHIFALADNVYRTMISETNNHFILISGESGAGKTEASKKVLQFYAVCCPSTRLLDNVRDRLLLSNPVLEAFGNAKTLKNDNSSQFGKYMDIQFDHQGAAVGGHILSYLLEKSRVVHQNHGERNFHIFYQLVEGGEDELLRWLGLERNCQKYRYLIQGECAKVSSINDKSDWKTVQKALTIIEFSEKDIEHLFAIIASVLHLGNVHFEASAHGYATLNSSAELLGIPSNILQEGLTHRKIEAKAEEVLSPFTAEHAKYARDALAKAIYGRTFTWLVNKINESLVNKDSTRKTVIGLLDIYGFEVFDVNSFEQFCINFCNEKLQQLFIQLTLKSEQEEYEMEGIEWEPVPYFNNKIICDLVEEKHRGIISILVHVIKSHLLFLNFRHKLADQKTRKTLERGDFRLLHYAGEVTYSVVGFIDKNNDLLYRNIKEVRGFATVCILSWPDITEKIIDINSKIVATQFKSSLAGLTEILMTKDPWYVRCLKPNHCKQPDRFDDVMVRHQVKYLGLMEHLRVRRAGFAYRRRYEIFLKRYKALCPDTWPHWKGTPAEGVQRLIKHLGYKPDEYKMGRTKIFIRHPRTLFATEDAFEICKHELGKAPATSDKRRLPFPEGVVMILTCWRGLQARRERERRAWAVKVIKKFIKGFMNRNQPVSMDNSDYLAFVRQSYLTRLKDNLPKSVLDKTIWLTPPPIMQEASVLLRKLHTRLLVRKYVRGISAQQKVQLQIKALTSDIFKGRKENYPQSVCQPFADTRININIKVLQLICPEGIKYSVPVIKYDRNGFRPRFRQLIFTQAAAYLVEEAKIKQRVNYSSLKGVSVSDLSDNFLILHVTCDDTKQKVGGEQISLSGSICMKLLSHGKLEKTFVYMPQNKETFDIQPGKEGFVDFKSSSESMVYRAKNGHLMVVSPHNPMHTT
uniref:Myosin IHb n=1 Tax=Cyprinus carpio TaxID=7962 RepID=A0A8C1QYH5_CYPCA